jgi:hypothetical protein
MEFERHSNGPLEPLNSELATGFFRAGHHKKAPATTEKSPVSPAPAGSNQCAKTLAQLILNERGRSGYK